MKELYIKENHPCGFLGCLLLNSNKFVYNFVMFLFSKLGLILVGIQTVLVVLIPVFAKIFSGSCSFICIFTQEQGYFFLFNLPGMYIKSLPFIHQFIESLETFQQRLNGEISVISYTLIFLFSAIIYYIIGLGIEIILWKKLNQFQNMKKAVFVVILGVFLSLVLFIVLSESVIRIANKLGQRIEQFQRCKNKNGFNAYEWETIKSEFNCKNGQYDGSYRVYKNGEPDQEYTYKNGKMICEKQYQCHKDLN